MSVRVSGAVADAVVASFAVDAAAAVFGVADSAAGAHGLCINARR